MRYQIPISILKPECTLFSCLFLFLKNAYILSLGLLWSVFYCFKWKYTMKIRAYIFARIVLNLWEPFRVSDGGVNNKPSTT